MKLFRSLFLQFLFWMLVFAVQRAIFLIYYWRLISFEQIPFNEVLLSFIHAVKLDISMASYLLIIPFLLLVIQGFSRARWTILVNKVYSFIILFIYLLTSSGELGLYGEWKSKLNFKALSYLRNPDEIFNSVSTASFILLSGLVLVQLFVFFFLYRKYFLKSDSIDFRGRLLPKILFTTLVPALLFVAIRGGIGPIPITASESYFSKHEILNLAAVNNTYNLVFNVINYYQFDQKNHFYFMPDDEALAIVKQLHQSEKDTTIHILNIDRPNIVIILLESWSGDLIESLGGEAGITPQFHELEKEALLFTNFYATGNRSQQALGSLLAGLPAIPITTITDHPEKYNALPSLITTLHDEGYYSSFFFGGDLNYGNIRSYLIHNQFDRLVDENDFDVNAIKGKLGVHDEGLFDKILQEIGNQPEPFFTATLTLSSHSPYDQPGERPIDWIDLENEYVNSAWYTDKCLGDFFREAKQKPWYDNTLFIVLADHSHASYNNYPFWSFDYRHIPLLLLGGAISDDYKNKKSAQLSSNVDLTTTILKQLNLDSGPFFWSKNMFNPYSPQFAYFELNDGFGWKTTDGFLQYNAIIPKIISTNVPKNEQDTFRKEGQAYIQVLVKEFIEY